MQYYFAPMEGITGYIYRNAHHDFFGGIDKYFTPFITPNQNKKLTTKEMRDVQPEHNAGLKIVPQIMTANAEHFMWAANKLSQLGYDEVNFNLGCPSRTVVSKGRGAGFLGDLAALDAFFDDVFAKAPMRVSVKSRIGIASADALPRLIEIFNRYPICELIIHPRRQVDYYNGTPDMAAFADALKISRHSVVFNGNLFNAGDVKAFSEKWSAVGAVMLGRGLIANPGLVEELQTGRALGADKLKAFLDRLINDYMDALRDPTIALFRMKEIWSYMEAIFADSEKYVKRIRKSANLAEYSDNVQILFDNCAISTEHMTVYGANLH